MKDYSKYYSEKELMVVFDATKYHLRKLGLNGIRLGGNGTMIYEMDEMYQIAKDKEVVDERFETELRKLELKRQGRKLGTDHVTVDELLQFIPYSRQLIHQVVGSTDRRIRQRVFGMWVYDKEYFKEWLLNEGRLANIREGKDYEKLGYKTYDKWLFAVRNW